jgi:hypothetical protein
MTPQSATVNVIRPLRAVGLIDEENRPTERARHWRDDNQYADVCNEIRHAVYPEELLDLFPGPEVDRSQAERWFANHTGQGQTAVQHMARFFALLTRADPSESERTPSDPREKKDGPKPKRSQRPTEAKALDSEAAKELAPAISAAQPSYATRRPSLHIDIQIHISPESSAEQIDHIFASMAKHLKLNESSDVD